MSSALEIVSLETLVSPDHIYRKYKNIWDFSFIRSEVEKLETDNQFKGYGCYRLFLCLLVQFMEDLSDRELARYLYENTSGKWFCGFNLSERTPHYSLFSKFRKKLGTKRLSKIFENLRSQLRNSGYMSEVFTFVDASHLISKASLWEDRDKAIKDKYDKLNNETLPKVASDKEARIGCKGGNKFWYGYKKHVAVDMQSGLINKVAVTPANVIDSKGLKHVSPKSGAVYADKGYCDKHAKEASSRNGFVLRSVKKNNMIGKNFDLDRWITAIRSPYERVFSKQRRRVRYQGVAKNQFAVFMEAIAFNFKRRVVLQQNSPPKMA